MRDARKENVLPNAIFLAHVLSCARFTNLPFSTVCETRNFLLHFHCVACPKARKHWPLCLQDALWSPQSYCTHFSFLQRAWKESLHPGSRHCSLLCSRAACDGITRYHDVHVPNDLDMRLCEFSTTPLFDNPYFRAFCLWECSFHALLRLKEKSHVYSTFHFDFGGSMRFRYLAAIGGWERQWFWLPV